MSGEGILSSARSTRPRRSVIITDVIVTERAGVLAHARAFCAALERWQLRGRYGAAESADIRRAVMNFATDIAIGLHVNGEDGAAVRAAMKARVKDMENHNDQG